jgi:putative hydrolase of the HAD superfamily
VDKAHRKEGQLIRCVAFDLDGVLIPSGPNFEYFDAERIKDSVQHNITPIQHITTSVQFGEVFRGSYELAMLGKVDLFEVLPTVLEQLKWKGTVEEFALEWFQSCAEADPEALRIVRALLQRGVVCHVASNQDNRRAMFLDSQEWIQSLFDRHFFSCRMGVKKPGVDFFRAVQQEIALLPGDILFVDDKLENVEGAQACGWSAEVCRSSTDLHHIATRYFPGLALP